MEAVKAQKNDAKQIAGLHKKGIPSGFISSLNIKVVDLLYQQIIKNEIVFVIKKDDIIIAFISCALNTKRIYKNFILANFFKILPTLFIKMFSIKFIVKIFETIRAPFKTKLKEETEELPELLSVVVNADIQAKGLGEILLNKLENKLIHLGINKYKVIAGENLVSANKYYQKYGFELVSKVEIHKGDLSNIYVKELNTR